MAKDHLLKEFRFEFHFTSGKTFTAVGSVVEEVLAVNFPTEVDLNQQELSEVAHALGAMSMSFLQAQEEQKKLDGGEQYRPWEWAQKKAGGANDGKPD